MASIRLNNQSRQNFKQAAHDDIMPQYPGDDDFIAKWASRAWETYYAPHQELIDQLPSELRTPTEIFHLFMENHEGKMERVDFTAPENTNYVSLRVGQYYHDQARLHFTIPVDHDIGKAFIDHRKKQQEWREKSRALRMQLSQLIDGLNTTKQLYDAWPQAEKYAACFPRTEPQRGSTTVTSNQMEAAKRMMNLSLGDEK